MYEHRGGREFEKPGLSPGLLRTLGWIVFFTALIAVAIWA